MTQAEKAEPTDDLWEFMAVFRFHASKESTAQDIRFDITRQIEDYVRGFTSAHYEGVTKDDILKSLARKDAERENRIEEAAKLLRKSQHSRNFTDKHIFTNEALALLSKPSTSLAAKDDEGITIDPRGTNRQQPMTGSLSPTDRAHGSGSPITGSSDSANASAATKENPGA